MKLKLLLLLLLSLCLAVFATTPYAGVEPSPFQPEINQLEAVINGLDSCLDRVQKVIAYPPNPILPSPNLNGAVNRLGAIAGQENSLNDFIANTILAVMGVEPSPFQPEDPIIQTLIRVGSASDAIAVAIEGFCEHPPEPGYECPEQFETALGNVMDSADGISETVRLGINGLLIGGGGVCAPEPELNNETACVAFPSCHWLPSPATGEPQCCCIIGY
jgi:hypothetical protein